MSLFYTFDPANLTAVRFIFDPANLTAVRFIFDPTPAGVVILDEFGFRN